MSPIVSFFQKNSGFVPIIINDLSDSLIVDVLGTFLIKPYFDTKKRDTTFSGISPV